MFSWRGLLVVTVENINWCYIDIVVPIARNARFHVTFCAFRPLFSRYGPGGDGGGGVGD
jgi:hypothetical protein